LPWTTRATPIQGIFKLALFGLFATGFVTMPAVLYTHHNYQHIDTSDVEESYDFNQAHRAGVADVSMIRTGWKVVDDGYSWIKPGKNWWFLRNTYA